MEEKNRIKLTDSVTGVIAKLAEGNPGATRICCELIKEGDKIDPNAAMGGLASLLGMDTLSIYGSRIWLLYKDVCGQSIPKVVAVLKGWQLGMLTDKSIDNAIDYGKQIDIVDLVAKIRERLPNFWKEEDKEEGDKT